MVEDNSQLLVGIDIWPALTCNPQREDLYVGFKELCVCVCHKLKDASG